MTWAPGRNLRAVLRDLAIIGFEPHQISAVAIRPSSYLQSCDADSDEPSAGRVGGLTDILPNGLGASLCAVEIGPYEAMVARGGALASTLAAMLLADFAKVDPGDLLADIVAHRRLGLGEVVHDYLGPSIR